MVPTDAMEARARQDRAAIRDWLERMAHGVSPGPRVYPDRPENGALRVRKARRDRRALPAPRVPRVPRATRASLRRRARKATRAR